MFHQILAGSGISVTEFKKNPIRAMKDSDGEPVAVLSHNEPAFYAVPSDVWAAMLDALEDHEDAKIVKERESRAGRKLVKVSLDDL